MNIILKNGRIITPFNIIEKGYLVIEQGIIKDVCIGSPGCNMEDYEVIDAGGNYISPGFIDIHTHGGGGFDFMDGTIEAFTGAAHAHALHGTTLLLPTTVAGVNEEIFKALDIIREMKNKEYMGAQIPGLHLEGPYFSENQKGAQDLRYIRKPCRQEYMEILRYSDDIVRWSAAPELEGALEFGEDLRERGIVASIAHSDATYDQVVEAFNKGYTHVTHLYSCTSGVKRVNSYRYAGIIESSYIIDGMTVEIIADGCHLPPSLLKLVYKIKGPEKIALVTDSIRAAGMGEGESIIGSLGKGQKVIIEDGVAKMPDRLSFAGSVATADRLVRTMVEKADVSLLDSVKMMTLTPAKIIGIDKHKGSIAEGKDADIVVFNKDIDICMVIIRGRVVRQELDIKN